ncbi:ATP-binding protein [Streptosporangium sp. NBC_01810]|uniref:ATP-binding protein n=1 Tax=Streptosporangium sp. NBC_01810 TaxID=2975951 RepID=UPI002DDA8E5C|nr:ATP-binding protein [Streptosporangium sp. NBC_01810]WSA29781.1 ATP-binding protein [Streptosporangium sp. NBC_01810]
MVVSTPGPWPGWGKANARYLGLPRHPEMVRRAREFARRAATDWAVSEEMIFTIEVLISELVTNSVRHAVGRHVRVWVRLRGHLLFVEVQDGGAVQQLCMRTPDLEAENGRGLLLVNALALRFRSIGFVHPRDPPPGRWCPGHGDGWGSWTDNRASINTAKTWWISW